ncbi:uncharacterized protein LOC131147750 [Malania oleifera]|uniref:uncharacterized protein LOC131147750 n=1 Tax=Malania oleifera TaxID=397392 RepID=UPI0025AE8424|nr:uncharacterized protein LOC131147750 [Malania oleifera]
MALSSPSSSSSSSPSPSPSPSFSSSSPPPPFSHSNLDPSAIAAECWAAAELTTKEILCRIRPILASEQSRKEIIDYVQTLIRCSLGCEVFPYGSFPLKTYLPDGDIDLTALSSPNVEEALAYDVCTVLKGEEQNENAAYEVKDVQYIGGAEVKLVKCLVQNVVVDISFNQLGGLCTLCFLEQVDHIVGKDHLFKRSIILIKAWCYYESRILGAHHGLISTYALEILVLYVIHVFHSSLNGPLAVLYRFLDYFSKFDWENYCISLNGPVCKTSLPDVVDEVQENFMDDLLLSEEFLRSWVDIVPVPVRVLETNSRAFPQKHLNIIDPLKENNNLGRSVNRGNFYRIRSAFRYGARKLGWILLLPRERITGELHKFFANTMERHRSKSEVDTPNLLRFFPAKGYHRSSPASRTSMCSEDFISLPNEDKNALGIRNEPERSSMETFSPRTASEVDCPASENSLLESYLAAGDAIDVATSGFYHAAYTSDFLPSSSALHTFPQDKSHHVHNSHSPGLIAGNGKIESENLFRKLPENLVIDDEEACTFSKLEHEGNHLVPDNSVFSCNNHKGLASGSMAISSKVGCISENSPLTCRKRDVAGIPGHSEVLRSFVDLSGDYENHIRSLLFGQYCHGYALSPPLLPSPPVSPSKLPHKNPWDTAHQSPQFQQNLYSQMKTNGIVLGSPFFHLKHPTLYGAAFSLEEKPKTRGTGTYFPKTDYRSYRDGPTLGKERSLSTGTNDHLQTHIRSNGSRMDPPETKLSEEGSYKFSKAEFPDLSHAKCRSSDFNNSHSTVQGSSQGNGAVPLLPGKLEFGSLGHLPSGVHLSKGKIHSDSGSPRAQGSVPLMPSAVKDSSLPLGNYQDRIAGQSYRLKDDDDFPPLSYKCLQRMVNT